MTSRDRILKVLNGNIPDRVPVTLFISDRGGHFLRYVYPNLNVKDYIGNKYKVIDLQRKLGADIHIRMSGGCSPLWLWDGGFNTITETKDWIIQQKSSQQGKSIVTKSKVKTPEGELYQEFTISEINPGTYHYACTKKPVTTIKDLNILKNYEPSINGVYQEYIKTMVSRVKDYLGSDGIVSMWIPGGLFNHAANLIDLNNLYMLYLIDNDFYNSLMSFCFMRLKPLIESISSTELDLVCIGGNVGGGFLGARIFEEYIFPYERKLISFIKNRGKKVLYHNCGQIMNLIEPYKKLGVDIIETFSPPPFLGDGDLAKAKKQSEAKFTIIGNIDQVSVIKEGNPILIKDKVKEALNAGKPGGRFILQPSDFLEYGTPFENVKAYIEAGKEYGGY